MTPPETKFAQMSEYNVACSDTHFDHRGACALTGVPGQWRLFAVKPT